MEISQKASETVKRLNVILGKVQVGEGIQVSAKQWQEVTEGIQEYLKAPPVNDLFEAAQNDPDVNPLLLGYLMKMVHDEVSSVSVRVKPEHLVKIVADPAPLSSPKSATVEPFQVVVSPQMPESSVPAISVMPEPPAAPVPPVAPPTPTNVADYLHGIGLAK